jgi:hypothetical protein
VYFPRIFIGLCHAAKALFANQVYHMVITSNIRVNRFIRWLEENRGKFPGGESVTAARGYGGGRSMGVLFVASLYFSHTGNSRLTFLFPVSQ